MARKKDIQEETESKMMPEATALILLVIAAVLLLSLISYNPNDLPIDLYFFNLFETYSPAVEPTLPRTNFLGVIGAILGFFQLQSIGVAAFFLPFAFVFFAVKLFRKKEPIGLQPKIGLALILLFTAAFYAVFPKFQSEWANAHYLVDSGGVLGKTLGKWGLEKLLSTLGAGFVIAIGYLFGAILFVGYRPVEFFHDFKEFLLTMKEKLFSGFNREGRPKKKLSSRKIKRPQTSRSVIEDLSELEPELALGQEQFKTSAPLKTDFSEVIHKEKKEEVIVSLEKENKMSPEENRPKIFDSTTKAPTPQVPLTEKPFERKKVENAGLSTDGFEDYELPGFELLDVVEVEPQSETNQEELMEMQSTIVNTLRSFGVDVTAGDITRGPTITRFEIYPSQGLRVNRITALEADLARATRAESINILAPIPGKDTVGIEIANSDRVLVSFSELLNDDKFRQSKRKIPLALGKDVYGEAVIGDLAAMPHLLVAGATGAGKSVCINTIIASILFKFGPDELRFIMVDPKVVEMQMYSKLPHLVVPVVTDPKKVVGALKWCVNEMERRYKLFAKHGVRNFDGYNNRERPELEEDAEGADNEIAEEDDPVDMESIESMAQALEDGEIGPMEDLDEDLEGFPGDPDEDEEPDRLPYIVIIIDELADLMQTAPADVEGCIARIAQKARAAGIHLIVATQTPRADVVTGIIKANIPSRIAFQVSSKIDSRVILDTGGADKLVGKGDMLFLPPGSAKLERSQGAFVSDEEVERIVEFCSEQAEQNFEESIQQSIESGGDDGGSGDDVSDADEELLKKCLEVIIQEQKASTSLLQRRLRLGYTRAARIVDIMEQRGYVGPADGAKPREVYAGK